MLRFHGVTTVAELKRALTRRVRLSALRFHGVTTVAELKPTTFGKPLENKPCFHGVTTVAELKRESLVPSRCGGVVSTASQPWPN